VQEFEIEKVQYIDGYLMVLNSEYSKYSRVRTPSIEKQKLTKSVHLLLRGLTKFVTLLNLDETQLC